jgi:hypothetical protein
MRFLRHSSGDRKAWKGSGDHVGRRSRVPFGTPSAGLSLGRLHACRARLRFARQIQNSATAGQFKSSSLSAWDSRRGVAKDWHFLV